MDEVRERARKAAWEAANKIHGVSVKAINDAIAAYETELWQPVGFGFR